MHKTSLDDYSAAFQGGSCPNSGVTSDILPYQSTNFG